MIDDALRIWNGQEVSLALRFGVAGKWFQRFVVWFLTRCWGPRYPLHSWRTELGAYAVSGKLGVGMIEQLLDGFASKMKSGKFHRTSMSRMLDAKREFLQHQSWLDAGPGVFCCFCNFFVDGYNVNVRPMSFKNRTFKLGRVQNKNRDRIGTIDP